MAKLVWKLLITYKNEIRQKSNRDKKLKIDKSLSLFEQCGAWKVDDDELVDLLHTKFFSNNVEEKVKTSATTLHEVIARFNGAYLVQQVRLGSKFGSVN